ncbi:DNA polymerase III subunit delta [Parasphaerochaeta coccoides]|nr:hypothetical protein [Parasphaerochaeta coccoides]
MAAPSAYLYLGPENGEKDAAVSRIRNALAGAHPALDEYLFIASKDDESIHGLSEALTNSGLFSDYSFILLRIASEAKVSTLQPVLDWLKEPTPDVTIVLTSDETRVSATLQKLVPKQNQQTFYEMFENRKPQWIQDFFRSRRMGISRGATDLILTLVDNSTDELKEACARLADYLSQDSSAKHSSVTEEDVEAYLSFSQGVTAFSVFEHVARGNLNGALLTIHSYMDAEPNKLPQLLAAMSWQMRRLLSLSENLSQGMNEDEAMQSVVTYGKPVPIRNLKDKGLNKEAVRRYSPEDIKTILVSLADWDRDIRSWPGDMHRTICDAYAYRIIIRKGKKTGLPRFASLRTVARSSY